jgi:hypothetical protein
VAEGFLDFTDGNILTAAQVDDYLMRQSVMRFASVAARDSALSGVLVEGMVAYLKDLNTLTAYDGSAWWTVGHATAAATGFTPAVVQAGARSVTVTVSEWRVTNGVCEWWFTLLIGNTGSAGSAVTVGLPVTASGNDRTVGSGGIYDASVPTQDSGHWELATSTTISFVCSRSTTGFWGVTPSLPIDTSDVVKGHVRYLVAAAA